MSSTVGGIGGVLSGLEDISADNADSLDAALLQKKKAKAGKGPKPLSGDKAESSAKPKAAARATPSELRVPAAIAKKITKSDKERAGRGNPDFLKKLSILQRYTENRVLAPILIERVSPTVYSHQPRTAEEADAKLQAFKVALNASRMDTKVDHLLAMAASGVVYATNNGALFNMDLTGYVERIWADKHEVAIELEEFKVNYGDWLSAPWHVRLALYFMQKAKETDGANNFLAQPLITQKDQSKSSGKGKEPAEKSK